MYNGLLDRGKKGNEPRVGGSRFVPQ